MGKFQGKFESARQDWATPPELFNPINEQFNFTIDLAASPENTKCPDFYSKDNDALAHRWRGIGWLNPPYGGSSQKLSEWVKKAYKEATRGGTIVMLIPARTNTRWWHDYCMKATSILFICGRPKFGGADHGLPQPLALIVFSPSQLFTPTTMGSFVLTKSKGRD